MIPQTKRRIQLFNNADNNWKCWDNSYNGYY